MKKVSGNSTNAKGLEIEIQKSGVYGFRFGVKKPKKKVGRPATGQKRRLSVRVDSGTIDRLEILQKKFGGSESDTLRRVISSGIDHLTQGRI